MAKVYVGRMPDRAKERDLQELFSKFGRIVHIDVKRGFGFVEFEDKRDAEDSVRQLNSIDFMGNRLAVEMSYSSQGERPARSRNSGGGGGGNSNRVPGTGRCFSCGQEGHWARECPRKSEGGSGNTNSGGDRSYNHRNNGSDRHHPYRPRITGGGGGRRGDRSPRRYSTNYDRSPSPHGRSPSPRGGGGGRDRGDRVDRNIDRDRYSPRKTADDRYSPKHDRSPVNKGDKEVDQRSSTPPPRKRTPSPVGRNPRNRSPDRGRDRGDRSDRDNRGNGNGGNDRSDRGSDRDSRDNRESRENRDNRSGSSDRQDRERTASDRDSRRKEVDSDSPKDKGGDDVHPMNDDD